MFSTHQEPDPDVSASRSTSKANDSVAFHLYKDIAFHIANILARMPGVLYGIYYPEDRGYLHVRHLTKRACVVRTGDGKYYVRKKTRFTKAKDPTAPTTDATLRPQHARVPKMISHRVHELGAKLRSGVPTATSIIHEYCNGGTLAEFNDRYAQSDMGLLPESIIWRIFYQLLDLYSFCHNCDPGITKLQYSLEDACLHYQPGSKFPDVYLTNFGRATTLSDGIWERNLKCGPRRIKDLKTLNPIDRYEKDVKRLAGDASMILRAVLGLFTGEETQAPEHDPEEMMYEDHVRARWSNELFLCLEALDKIVRDMRQDPLRYNDLAELRETVEEYAKAAEVQWPKPDVMNTWLRMLAEENRFAGKQQVSYYSKSELKDASGLVPGPWRIAMIDADTGIVIEVDQEEYNKDIPRR
jgi:hypothetical protein